MMSIRNASVPCSLDLATKPWIDLVSSDLTSTFMPAPGCRLFTTMRPTISAIVVSTSK